ncbi:MAG: MAPEG family protein [Myxococcota bacterium]
MPPDPLQITPWIARAYRAHQNLLEQAFPFAVVIILCAQLNVSTTATKSAAIAFVVFRLAHAVGMMTAWTRMPLRPLIFTAGYFAILILSWQLIAHAG